jgi:hypothetical protein
MALTFRTAMLSEGEEAGRVIRAAFTPYVRILGRELPADGSVRFAEERERFAAELERGDVYVGLDGEQIVGAVRTQPQENALWWRDRAASAACRSRPPRLQWPISGFTSARLRDRRPRPTRPRPRSPHQSPHGEVVLSSRHPERSEGSHADC